MSLKKQTTLTQYSCCIIYDDYVSVFSLLFSLLVCVLYKFRSNTFFPSQIKEHCRLFKSSVSVCLPINVYFRLSLILYLFGFQCLYCVLVLTTILCFINKKKNSFFKSFHRSLSMLFSSISFLSLSNEHHAYYIKPPSHILDQHSYLII